MQGSLNSFNMDYRQIFFLYCDDKDEFHILDDVYRIYGRNSSALGSIIVFFSKSMETTPMPFQLTGAAHYEVGDQYFTHRKGMDSYQLICTCSGHGIIKTETRKLDCLPGTTVLVNCRDEHIYTVPEGEIWNYKHVHFTPHGPARSVAGKAAETALIRSEKAQDYLDDILFELHDVSLNSPFMISHAISSILTEIIQSSGLAGMSNPRAQLVQRSVKYMREHYMEKISINELAQREFVSTFYFIRLFKEYYGVPPYDYLMNYRLNQSKMLLLQKKSVKETALQCGFSNINSYSRAFKKYMGISPNQYLFSKWQE